MNLLLLMTDQQHKYALGCVSPFVKTPHLDQLASEGTLFSNAYSNNPVCGPFRGILYSGKYSKDNQVLRNGECLPENEVTLPMELYRAGYETSFVGKLHLGATGNAPVPEKFRAGHQHFIGYQCYNGFLDHVCFYDEDHVEHRYDGQHRTDVTADLGIERLKMLAKSKKPFIHTIFFQAPHYPEEPSLEYAKQYEDTKIPFSESYQEVDPYTPTQSPYSPRPFNLCKNYQIYGNNMDMYLRLYYAMVTQIDYNVGRILATLKELGIKEDTAVIFSSDHGDMQGSHGLKNKCLPFERSCGVPMIIKVPNCKQNPIVTKPVSSVDIYPTCLELAGLSSLKELPGRSLLPLIKGDNVCHPPVFAENVDGGHNWIMYRDDRYKLVLDRTSYEPKYLFDMENDRNEEKNLIRDEGMKEVLGELSRRLIAIYSKKY